MAAPNFSTRDAKDADRPVRVVSFEIPGGVTTPQEFAVAVEAAKGSLSGEFGVIFDGRGPVWGFGMLIHAAHPTQFVACRDPRLGAVVVESHVKGLAAGDVIAFPEA